jgi:hypothetical protein
MILRCNSTIREDDQMSSQSKQMTGASGTLHRHG